MFNPSLLHPDVALRDYLTGRVLVGETPVPVYGDWEKPTNRFDTDFIAIYLNGDPDGVGMDTPFARGNLMVSLYCKMNDDGTVKKNRIDKIMAQFDTLVEGLCTGDYHYAYDTERFITPTTPNQSSGYSLTTLNLKWTTTSNFNSQNQ